MTKIDYVAIGSIVIDDIVDPQGCSTMGMLGGGASHAVSGMRVWSDKIALVAVIGDGFPEKAWKQLQTLTDTRGILSRPVPQPRFWHLFEVDGTRNEVPRTDFELFQQIPIAPKEYPHAFARASGVYLQTPTAEQALAWAVLLRAKNPEIVLLWEPWEIFYRPEHLPEFQRVVAHFDIISPQTAELSWMLGETDPEKQADIMFDCGVRCLALRMGANGSLVGTAKTRQHISTVPTTVVDQTGAGNAYCGGFVVGYVESGGDPVVAGQYGAVSATFALAQAGVAHIEEDVRSVAEVRLKRL